MSPSAATDQAEFAQQLEHAIQQQAAAHPDHFIFASFPAAGPALTPRLLAAFGFQRQPYRSAEELGPCASAVPFLSKELLPPRTGGCKTPATC